MFAPKKKVQKVTAELAAKKRSAAINIGKIGGMKKPISDNTSVKSPTIKSGTAKTMQQSKKEFYQKVRRDLQNVMAKPDKTSVELAGYKKYEKGNMSVRVPYRSKTSKSK